MIKHIVIIALSRKNDTKYKKTILLSSTLLMNWNDKHNTFFIRSQYEWIIEILLLLKMQSLNQTLYQKRNFFIVIIFLFNNLQTLVKTDALHFTVNKSETN